MSNPNNIPIPARESIIAAQVHTLLAICHTLNPFVLHETADDDWKKHPEFDGGAPVAATVALLAVFDRLTKITQDDANWGMEGQKKLEDALLQVYQENAKALQAARYAATVAAAPVNVFKPTVAQTADGKWCAIHGQVLGIGNTPEEALQDFGAQFKMTVEQANKIVADPVIDAEIHPNLTPRRKRKRNK